MNLIEHISQIRDQISQDTFGVRVLVGCETEYVGGGWVGISPQSAELLDFVLVPHSHFHMEGFVRPAETKPGDGRTQDIYVSARNAGDASTGDTVLVRVHQGRPRPGQPSRRFPLFPQRVQERFHSRA